MAEPLLKWAGSKRWLASQLAGLVKQEFERYFEPFLGGGAFLFALEPGAGLVADLNPDLIGLYRAIREDGLRVLRELESLPATERQYYQIRDEWRPTSRCKRAARILYLIRHSWNGLYRVNRQGHFNVPYCRRERKNQLSASSVLEAQRVLKRVSIKCQAYGVTLAEAAEHDFAFVDPPYFEDGKDTFRRYTSIRFGPADQHSLVTALCEAERRGVTWLLTNGSLRQLLSLFPGRPVYRLPRRSMIAAVSSARGWVDEYVVISKGKRMNAVRDYLRPRSAPLL